MTPARACRQILFTLLLCVFLRACVPWFQEDTDLDAQGVTAMPTITIDVSPHVQLVTSYKTGSVAIHVTVPRDARNRVVCVVVDGPMFRASCWEQVGREAPFRQEFSYPGLPAGEYVVEGRLEWVEDREGEKGERRVTLAHDRFVIRGGEDPEEP